MSRTHDRQSFYKYMTARTAQLVLSTKKLRYSKPYLFNDPFDNQINTHIRFDLDELRKKTKDEFREIIRQRQIGKLDLNSKMGVAMHFLLTNAPEDYIDELVSSMHESVDESISKLPAIEERFNEEMRAGLDSGIILCVSELKDSLLMWSHYANEHRGVVLELACLDETNNTLLTAKPIQYSSELPQMASIDGFIKFHTGQAQKLIDSEKITHELVYTKSIEWKYEKEWRVWIAYEYKATEGYYDYLEDPRVFKSLYLGCRMSDDDERSLIQLVGSDPDLRHMEIFKAHKSETKFALEFSKMTL